LFGLARSALQPQPKDTLTEEATAAQRTKEAPIQSASRAERRALEVVTQPQSLSPDSPLTPEPEGPPPQYSRFDTSRNNEISRASELEQRRLVERPVEKAAYKSGFADA